jgi:hypothetical protein
MDRVTILPEGKHGSKCPRVGSSWTLLDLRRKAR